MRLAVRIKRESGDDQSLELPFGDLQKVQDLLQVLAGADVSDLLVEVRFGEANTMGNGKLESEQLATIEKSAKYTYG